MPTGKSPKPCSSLDEVRANIDRIDGQLVALMSERESFVRQAARFKPSVEAVVVPARVEQIINRVTSQARELGASPMVIERVYRAMIDAMTEMEVYEHRALHKDTQGDTQGN